MEVLDQLRPIPLENMADFKEKKKMVKFSLNFIGQNFYKFNKELR